MSDRSSEFNSIQDVLKRAMLLEMNGKEFFRMAARTASSDVAKELFEHMVKEEEHHLHILEITFKRHLDEGKVILPAEAELAFGFKDPIIDKSFLIELKNSQFDSSAISIALTLEERAFKFYQKAEAEASDPEIKKLFTWLADWELEHHQKLMDLEADYREEVWNDSSFWPM
ncbi:MAG: ferritin family protein [Candidatus Marinimicrobia bacterium]|nr:ferritin family protein [Candidatus Neomarinimicrobiota bacterium]MCF7850464.1 ferritin family protein [Candidatus Neomarinimicrobiota bacterium]MCF7905185.1 ferritin family protein [Candidatus Neomarinimicrobiota bacterium]